MKKLFLICALVLGIGSGTALAQDFKIVGLEEPVPVGELIILKADGKFPEGTNKKTYSWKVMVGNKEKKRVYVPSNDPDTFMFTVTRDDVVKKPYVLLVVNYNVLVKDKDGKLVDADLKSSGILIEDIKIDAPEPPPPPPGPDPNPNPTPDPDDQTNYDAVAPDSPYGLTKLTYNYVANKSFKPKKKTATISALYTTYNNVAQLVNSGQIQTVPDIMKKASEDNRDRLLKAGGVLGEWQGLDEVCKKQLADLYNGGKLKTMADYGAAFQEIADGLKLALKK